MLNPLVQASAYDKSPPRGGLFGDVAKIQMDTGRLMASKSFDLADSLAHIASGKAKFKLRAALENYLLEALRAGGVEGVIELLRDTPTVEIPADPTLDRLGGVVLPVLVGNCVISISLQYAPTVLSVNVSPGRQVGQPQLKEDPRHVWFYMVWQRLLKTDRLAHLKNLEGAERAVALIGLLEAEMMNGGVGQYLTNTGGVYVKETLELLKEIGAKRTKAALAKAAAVKAENETFEDAWERKAQVFEKLDAKIASDPEDLAGLVAALYPQAGDGPAQPHNGGRR